MNLQRDPDGVLHIVPVSGGHDSTCTALLLREREPRARDLFRSSGACRACTL